MPAETGLIAVDWGTTNRRVFVIDTDGNVTDRFTDGAGVTAILPGEFPAVIDQLRERCGDAPKLLAGMIGSNRGWVEAPYVECPATLDSIVEALVRVRDDVRIVPGVCDRNDGRADVLRGEEVQLLGALAAGMIAPDAAACHPGTHAKWARLDGGAIAAFRTVMTGEMFALLRKHSLLTGPLSGAVTPGAAFQAGVARAFERRELLSDLFGIRARLVLGMMPPEDTASFGSGLLIGTDVAIGLDFVGAGPVALIGEPGLTRLYACALAQAGRQSHQVDGEAAFIAGVRAIAGNA